MAINFPQPTSQDQIYTDPTSGITYQWVGTTTPVVGSWVITDMDAMVADP